jgi:hypothetical protein
MMWQNAPEPALWRSAEVYPGDAIGTDLCPPCLEGLVRREFEVRQPGSLIFEDWIRHRPVWAAWVTRKGSNGRSG